MVSTIEACLLLKKGCQGFLCSVLDTRALDSKLEDILIIQNFSAIFPKELPSNLVEREVEFGIDVMPGIQPISRATYQMDLVELKELKIQLQELLNKGFIRPSISPWGAPVLFGKKKDGPMRM